MGHVNQYTKRITNLKGVQDYFILGSPQFELKFWYALRVQLRGLDLRGLGCSFSAGLKNSELTPTPSPI